ncbi:gag-polypeptide of LTR copia-type [Phytophthora infestans]|uniref:Gag-polypeptide of LTR copia-type n=2 Tax=Phytophthora infestans TaxID=4787 RepID=A0A833S3G4_PHYIN|nr:gag-polypeptide of LTR copia-type [Phytophthora infestans]
MRKRLVMILNRASLRGQGSSRKAVRAEPKGRKEGSKDTGNNSSEAASEPSGSTPSSPSSGGASASSSSASSVHSNISSEGRSSSKRKRATKKKGSSNKKRSRSAVRDTLTLEVPKLTGADDYELWRTAIELKVKKRHWNERWLKAQAVIPDSLDPRLAGRYRRLLVSCDPVQLFVEIEKEYNAGSTAKNDILIKTAMFARKLTKRERVDTYIDAVMQLQEDLVTLGHPLEDAELARLLLTNALEVFPDLRTEFVGARMKARSLKPVKYVDDYWQESRRKICDFHPVAICLKAVVILQVLKGANLLQMQFFSFRLEGMTATATTSIKAGRARAADGQ